MLSKHIADDNFVFQQESTSVRYARITDQLLHRKILKFLSSKLWPQQPRAKANWLQDSITVSCEWRRLKKWSSNSNIAFEWKKMRFSCICVLPGSEEASIMRGGKIKHLLRASFIITFLPIIMTRVRICQSYTKTMVGRFLRHSVEKDYICSICSMSNAERLYINSLQNLEIQATIMQYSVSTK